MATIEDMSIFDDGSRFQQDQLKKEVFSQKIRRDAKRLLEEQDREAAASQMETSPRLVYDPLPAESPELIPGLLPESGTAAIVGETDTGKAQPLDAKVLTPSGWTLMGLLQVGDELASHDGVASSVVAVHPRGMRQVYRVTFTDGRSTEACAEHLWAVEHPNWFRPSRGTGKRTQSAHNGPKLLTTQQLSELSPSYKRRIYIPVPDRLDFGTTTHLPIDPWLLGMLIGDGSLTGGTPEFTTSDDHIVRRAEQAVDAWLEVHKKPSSRYTYSITRRKKSGHPNTLKASLDALGLTGCRSWEKAIPERYMKANRAAREELLTGLIDTDGYVDKSGVISVTTTSPTLADQIVYLARSVGGVTRLSSKMGSYRKAGISKRTRLAYTITIWHPFHNHIVSLPHKVARLRSSRRRRPIAVRSVVASRVVETQCITVSHPRGLYITDDFIVTHNSLIACEIGSSLLTGEPLWGAIRPTRKIDRVVYILGEHTCVTLQGLFHRTKLPHEGKFMLIGPEHLHPYKGLVIGGVQQGVAIDRLLRWTEGAGLIVFDPLAGFVQGLNSEQDNSAMRTLIDAMSLVATKNQAACLILSHMGKPRLDDQGGEVRRSSYAMRGASSQEDSLTHVFYLRKAITVKQQKSLLEHYDLAVRKFKGSPSNDVFRLERDPETKRNVLKVRDGVKSVAYPTLEIKQGLAEKYTRVARNNPGFTPETCLKMVADMEGMEVLTVERWLSGLI